MLIKNRFFLLILVGIFYFSFHPGKSLAVTCGGHVSVPLMSCSSVFNPVTGVKTCSSWQSDTRGEDCYYSETRGECITFYSNIRCFGTTCNSNNDCEFSVNGMYDCAPDGESNAGTTGCCESIDGNWGSWSSCYSNVNGCLKDRACNNPAPSCEGADCSGDNWTYCTASELGCTVQDCPTNCDYAGGDVRDGTLNGDCTCGSKSCSAQPPCCTDLSCSSKANQYIETPQRTGSIWVEIGGVSGDRVNTTATGVSFPTWSDANGQDDIIWYSGTKTNSSCTSNCSWRALINLADHAVTNTNPKINVHAYMQGCNKVNDLCNPGSVADGVYPQTILINDKTCSVAVTPLGGKNFSVTVSGDGSLNPGTQTGRLWVERQDTSQVANYATEIIPATVEAHNPGGPYYYNFISANLSSTNSAVDSKTINVTLPGGNYYFHCDMPEDIGANYVKCSGNPFCSYEGLGGGLTCTNWKSCSNNDRATVCSEGQTCALRCNQAKDCGGFCTGEDAGTPAAPIVVSPLGSAINPVILTDTTPLLDWSGSDPLTDSYEIVVINPSNAVVWTGTTTAATTSISVGTALTNNITYRWYARALNSTCSPYGQNLYSLPSGYGYFRINSPPVIGNFYIFNVGNAEVVAEAGSRNHICQSDFNGSRFVNFRLNVSDTDGVNDISQVSLNWNGTTYTLSRGVTWPTGATYTTTIDYGTYHNQGIYEIRARAVDFSGTTVDQGTGRNWKVWNCQVPVEGNLYDGSADHSCIGGFNNLAELAINFNALIFNNSTESVAATVTIPNAYVVDIGSLIWNRSYLPLINGGNAFNPNGDLAATARLTRMTDLGTGAQTCPVSDQFVLNVSPYSSNPSAKIDFSFIRDQESWYQVRGGGIRAGDSIQSGVPVTANPLERYLTLGKSLPTTINNGLVSYAVNFSNTNGYNDEAYGSPNSWWKNSSLLPATRYGYQYFYNNLYVKAGVGVTGRTWDEKPSEGVFFVDGNLNIDSNFVLPADNFFMVVVSGNITIANGVTQIDGIYVSDGGISTTGNLSNQALVINGMLYSRGSIRLARSFSDKTLNNTSPATIVNYRPSLLFNMPIKISKVISGWRED